MNKLIKYFFIPLFLLIIFFVFYNNVYKKISITYYDEQAWISHGYFFELLINRDFNNPLWEKRLQQPILTDYMYGAMIYSKYLQEKRSKTDRQYDLAEFLIDYGFYDNESIPNQKDKLYKDSLYDFPNWGPVDFEIQAETLIKKYGHKFRKTIDLIFSERIINIYLLSFNVIIVYYISLFCFGSLPSLLVSLLFGVNDFIVDTSLRAQTEGLFLFLFNLDLLLLILALRNRKIIYFMLFAIITGLMIQTKLNGIIMLLIFNVLISVKIISDRFLSKKIVNNKILLFLSVNILTFLVFINTNFFIIKSPIKNMISYYQYKNIEAQQQADNYPINKLDSPIERVKMIYRNFLYNPHFMNVSDLLHKNINRITNNGLYRLFFRITFLLGMGAVFLLFFKKKNSINKLIFVVFLLTQIIMSLYLIMNWSRYYIQIALFFIIFSVLGLTSLINFIIFQIKKYAFNFSKH